MKTILIPTEDHDAMPAVLEAARLIGERFGSYMEGFAVHPAPADFVAVDPVSSLTIASTHDNDEEVERGAQRLFENFMRTHGVPGAEITGAEPGPAVYSHGWVRSGALGDAFIGSHGRLFDLIVLGRPGRAPQRSAHAAARSGVVRKRPAGADRAVSRCRRSSAATCWSHGTAAPSRPAPPRSPCRCCASPRR